MKTEIFDFPVFKTGEPMPLKYYIHADILGSIISRRQSAGEVVTPEIKEEIKAAIQRQLKKYCRADEYRMAAVIRQKRYKLNGEEAEKISDKDMHGFIALVRAAERRKSENGEKP
ncbi:MAG: ProQ/FINO family protein [Planctomycetia bacterium]|nr:ProQ/FINO family protein [Planctomycetia bacterium]